MKITQAWLKEQLACPDGYKWACGILKDKPMEAKKFIKITADHRMDWANWVIVRVMDYDQYVSYAVYAAEQVIDIYEKKYPNDKRPRNAIEAAKKCIGLKGAAARDAAGADARDARDAWAAEVATGAAWAARAAEVAAWAAWAACAVGAARAARAAEVAAWAAGAACAVGAARAAAEKEMKIKILNYGLTLLKD